MKIDECRLPVQKCPDKSLSWSESPSSPELSRSDVDVWCVWLDQLVEITSASSVLSPDELRRASRFLYERDRIHFVRCRSALRCLLSRYLRIPAAEIRFDYQPDGKPELVAWKSPGALRFNVSHSGALALIAVTTNHRIGVDIEKIRADVDTTTLADRFFSAREQAGLRALPDPLRVPAFFACWTRKESFLKGTGRGLSFPLEDFSVTTHPDFNPALEEIQGDTEAGKQWSLADLSVFDGYRATVAVDCAFSRLETYTLS